MQCPRCGENTPGTLSGCARCGAPVDRRTDPQAAQPGGTGSAAPSLDVTMLDPQQPAPQAPATPEAGLPPLDAPPPAPWAANMTMVDPLGGLPGVPDGGRDAAGQAPAPAESAQEEEPGEDTQAWTMPPDDEDEDDAPQAGLPALPAPPPPAPAWAAGPAGQAGGEALVPDSWFAEPRPPAPEGAVEQPGGLPDAGMPQPWAQSPAPAALPAPVGMPGGYDAPGADQGWSPQGVEQGWQTAPGMQPGGDPYQDPYQQPAAGYGNATAVYEGGYPPPGEYPAAQGGGGRSNKPLAIGVAVLVMVALVAVGLVLWPDGGGTAAATGPSASATPRSASEPKPTKARPSAATVAQARQVHALLNASADTRNALGRALSAAARCKTLPAAIQGFQQVAVRRNNQIQRTRALKVDQLKEGEKLRASLLRSFQLSLEVDQAFLAWAQKARSGCKGRPKRDADYRRGNTLSAQATVAKKRFTLLWNPIARDVGLPTRTDRQF
ncbi:hypothetical protein [Thermomonospora amylolytica]|uniref:hypothetical protein n=1 Tax=Thermomonospora amylolytica TaxID=1411117 RepID=UPI000E6D39AC|nr:hypothetical protein [Thermomonospora amylolytica]